MTDHFVGLRIVRPEVYRDARGQLSVIELERLGFDTKRVFFIDFQGVPPGTVRAEHAASCAQLLVPVRGAFTLELSNGESLLTLIGRAYDVAFLLSAGVWRRLFNGDDDCLIMVLANASFDSTTYFPQARPELIA